MHQIWTQKHRADYKSTAVPGVSL